MFDWENAIALDTMQVNWASSSWRGKSHVFSRVAAGTWGVFSSYSGDVHSKILLFIEVRNLSMYEGQLRNVN